MNIMTYYWMVATHVMMMVAAQLGDWTIGWWIFIVVSFGANFFVQQWRDKRTEIE